MAVVTLVATVEPNNLPPRVRIDVTSTGTPAISSVVVTRTDPSGAVVSVRTNNGEPLVLFAAGDDLIGTVYDYEMPYGRTVTYSTAQQPASTSNTVSVNEESVWLIHPGIPARSVPITLMRGSNDEEEEDVAAGVFYPLGRRNAVVISDGRRKAPSSELIVGTETWAEHEGLRDLLLDAYPLLLNVPPLTGLGINTTYIFVGALRRRRVTDIGWDVQRNWTLPYRVVDMPVGGAQSLRTWQDVLDENATWQDVLDDYDTWADLQAPTT